jgi:flavodoxin I
VSERYGRAYVLVNIVPGMEQEFANEVVSKGLLFDSKVEKMDFLHGGYDFIIILHGSTHDIDRRILEMRKLPYVRSTQTMVPFEMLNWEVISATYTESQPHPAPASPTRKAVRGVKNVLVLYSSVSGNTEKMAMAVAEGVSMVKNTKVELKRFVKAEDLENYDAILVGAPTYKDDMPTDLKKLFDDVTERNISLKGKVGATFGSYGWGGEAPKYAYEIMKHKFEMKTPEPPLLVKQTPDQNALELCKNLGKKISECAFQPA